MSSTSFKPFIAPEQNIPEFGLVPLLAGAFLGIIFGASSLYLALKVGATVSASIPVAVLAITLFRTLSKAFGIRKATILENNIVQATGSAGESIAFGVAVTFPALLIMGFNMDLTRIMTVAILGGLLGVLMMIPLRWALIVKEHGTLTYPEGTACAEILIAGEKGGTSARTVFTGFFVGLLYKFFNVGMKLWHEMPAKAFGWFKGASVAADVSPELLGVGYIIGPRVACLMMAGALLANWVMIPAIFLFGQDLTSPLYPGTKLIAQMELREVWRSYILYIGAGAVATGGIISLFRSMPSIVHGAKAGFRGLFGAKVDAANIIRTERDIPMIVVVGGSLLLILGIWAAPGLHVNLFGALLIVIFGFLFVTVSSRLTGEVGSSSNPISGMTVATLLITSLIFLLLGWVDAEHRISAMCVAAVVCIAASNAGTTSQDLKTGYIIGGTPKYQQLAVLFGALTSAAIIGYTLNVLNDASTIYSTKNFPADVVVENVSSLTEMASPHGPDYGSDTKSYHVFRLPETPQEGPYTRLLPGKYLVDDTGVNDTGHIQYFVDPGINGSLTHRDNGTTVLKYDAPKARLMALIIDGILQQKLPWGLVLLGVFMAIAIEMMGIASLPVAVGIYLPISSSFPVFIGGMMRWVVEKVLTLRGKKELAQNSDSGPGVLFSSGLIAGGSIAGIALAILSVRGTWGASLDMSALWPNFSSSHIVAALMFALMAIYLVKTGLGARKDD